LTPAPPKPVKPVPDLDYRKHIQAKGCLCNSKECYGMVVMHHLNTGGTGSSGPDHFNGVPFCFGQHHTSGIHTMPERKFEQKHNLPHLRSLAIVFGVGYFGAEKSVELLAIQRGIDMDSAEAIILNAIDNVNNGTKEWVG
jgi:hypothetical protein